MTIHIATSADLGRVVRRGIREPVGFVSDNWLVGPCGADPEGHARARGDYLGLAGRARARLSRSLHEIVNAVESEDRVVVWTSRLGSDTVALWALCAWRLRRWPDKPNLGVVVLGGPAETEDAAGVGGGFIRVTPGDARLHLERVRSLSVTRAREMAGSWRKLSGHSPILSGKGDWTARERRQLAELGAYQAGFFPRSGERGLLLSRFDEFLFSCLGDRGSTAADVFVSQGTAGEELRSKWCALTGDVFLATRLAQWARHDAGNAALISEPYRADRPMMAARYRLSEVGHAMKRDGLGEIARGAPLPVWGAIAYDPRDPWVVVEDGERRQRLLRREVLPLRGTAYRFEDPTEPAVPADDWEA